MKFCIDIGNTQITAGLIDNGEIVLRFSCETCKHKTAHEYAILFKNIIRENGVDPSCIKEIGVCSVVPSIDSVIYEACEHYFSIEPLFLKAGVKTGLKIKYNNPLEVGADRIADAVAAVNLYPEENIIIGDFGTATVFCAITKKKEYLGGAIMPGMLLSMEALSLRTAKLSAVEIAKPKHVIGKSTAESIQSGLYYSHLGAIREFYTQFKEEAFSAENVLFIGTGGFCKLLENGRLFDHIEEDLVLKGMDIVLSLNQESATVA